MQRREREEDQEAFLGPVLRRPRSIQRVGPRAMRPDPRARCSDLKIVTSDITPRLRKKILTQRRGAGWRGGQRGGMTSRPILIKCSPKRKRLQEGLGSLSLLLLFFRVSELFPGFGGCQQNTYCTLWCISNEIVFPSQSRLQTPVCLEGKCIK